ncbi:VasL domain-containing protein [Dryocola clanedunensis]|uniref:VasL domain-containing protein n=1 Tax=Cedecea sulfonylureivorans TaxID=3051154 RepID=UPI0019295AAC|nr:VasL domain-containing protein [Cedecea sulfonylureivorans]
MHDPQPRPVRTGSDPRSLPDFAALREEMSKLTHPARPDVDWGQVETLSLALFEHNGVELQTAAWYTLARSHLARVNGMNEGLSVLVALPGHQWTQLWPQPTHARVEIINGLLQRLQKTFRTFSLDHNDLPALLSAEKLLTTLDDIFSRQALKHACQTVVLSQQVHNALIRLENSTSSDAQTPAVALPAQALKSEAEAASSGSRLVYVIRPEPEVNVDVVHEMPPSPKRWPTFLAGACTALVVGAVTLWGWHYLHRVDDASRALTASVTALPQALNHEQLHTLQQAQGHKPDPATWLKRTSTQLDALARLSPDWTLRYGNALLGQAQALWPESKEVAAMRQQWQQQLAVNALPANALNGWHNGMTQLQSLSDKLDALDGQKGKYITVSELKSMVFGMITSFRQTVPFEEQLRMLDDSPAASASLQAQSESHLQQLINAWSTLSARAEENSSHKSRYPQSESAG